MAPCAVDRLASIVSKISPLYLASDDEQTYGSPARDADTLASCPIHSMQQPLPSWFRERWTTQNAFITSVPLGPLYSSSTLSYPQSRVVNASSIQSFRYTKTKPQGYQFQSQLPFLLPYQMHRRRQTKRKGCTMLSRARRDRKLQISQISQSHRPPSCRRRCTHPHQHPPRSAQTPPSRAARPPRAPTLHIDRSRGAGTACQCAPGHPAAAVAAHVSESESCAEHRSAALPPSRRHLHYP
ncbi:hypothetical protein DENSPDRAFT_452009 [Dentipellis sp. KUC8613]|nr:hypothetical protein DENSPDRAFT_452009 [Dentipellis sp. KUC8613]